MARKILLADDSVTAQNMGRKILADAGYDVFTVNNGSAALKRITEIKPDLIVLDVYMPGYSGLEVCQRLKESADTSHIPVLLTVGKLEPFKPEEARRARADAHIVKPFEASELLTAITRLEDRVVPQQAESDTDLDTGWKSRLRFPSKKKKEEPEPEREDFAPAPAFREFRPRKGKKETREAFAAKAAAPPEPEPALVPDIPRDITPEELDALSALAAKLDGSVSAENPAAAAEKTDPVEAPVAEEFAAAETEMEVPAAEAETKQAEVEEKKEVETPSPAPAEIVEVAVPAVEAPAVAVEVKKEAEIPAAPVEPASEVAAVVADPPAVAAVEVNAALLAQEPAAVDREDEPIFASAETVVEPATEDKAGEKTERKTAEELKAEEPAPPAPVVETVQEPTAAVEEVAPSDVELAEALRLLTPATGHANVSPALSPETLVAAGPLPPEEMARAAAAGARWVAEPVAMSSEEAAISLEAEMFRTFTAKPTAMSGGEIEPERITGVAAIAAAVENRLAEAGITATATGPSEPEAEGGLAEPHSEIRATETPRAEAPAEVMAASSNAAILPGNGAEPEIEKEIKAEKIEAEKSNPPENVAEEEPAAATFADAVGRDEIEAAGAVSEENQDSSSEAGGQESMSTDGKGKGKSNWHQIHKTPANAAAKGDVVEAAKAEHGAEETPRVMAAAAAEGSAPVPAEASAIASIVDSVLADLRPKIVEEIAKKLAGK